MAERPPDREAAMTEQITIHELFARFWAKDVELDAHIRAWEESREISYNAAAYRRFMDRVDQLEDETRSLEAEAKRREDYQQFAALKEKHRFSVFRKEPAAMRDLEEQMVHARRFRESLLEDAR